MDEASLEELSEQDCLALLRSLEVGRVGVVVEDYLVVVPVNYRLVEDDTGFGLVIRTRAGGVVDRVGQVAFEIDGIDPVHHLGWSVLVRGTATHVDPGAVELLGTVVDPRPWVAGRDAWMIVRPIAMTGRQLRPPELEWVFGAFDYL